MANRYWVGGSGTWNTTSTTNWSAASALSFTASRSGSTLTTVGSPALVVGMTVRGANNVSLGTITGGSGNTWTTSGSGTVASQTMKAATVGASVPTAADSVFFDANSSGTTAYTVTLTGALTCLDITVSANTPTFAQIIAPTLAISGSMSLASGTVWSTTGAVIFNATTTGKTITTNGTTISGAISFNGSGGSWTLGSALTSGPISILAGTLDTSSSGNYSITTQSISNSGSGTCTLNLNASTLTLSATGSISFSGSAFTLNAGTSQINITSTSSLTFTGGAKTFYNVSFTGAASAAATITINNANTFNNLAFTSPSTANNRVVSFAANQTINGTLSGSGPTANQRLTYQSDAIGTTRTLTLANAATISNADFRDITAATNAITATSGGGDCGGNTNITFPSPKTVYWNLAGTQNWAATAWATTPTGTPAVANFPLAQDTAVFTDSGAAGTITTAGTWNVGSVVMSGRTSAMSLVVTPSLQVYGSWAHGTGVSTSGSNAILFLGRGGTQTLTSNGATFGCIITAATVGGTVQLNDALNSTTQVSLTSGTLKLQSYTITSLTFLINSSTSRTLDFGTGNIVLTGSGVVWLGATATNFTTTSSSSTCSISLTSASAKSFNGGGATYNCTLNQGGAGALTIGQSNTFYNITNTVQPTTISFVAGTTTTVQNFTVSGTAGNLVTLNSTTSGTSATISKSSGTVSCDYLSIQDSTATGGASWYAGANSTNVSNNTGWIFTAPPATAYTITATAGSYVVSGQTSSLYRSKFLTASYGVYTTAGQTVGVAIGRLLSAQNGVYSVAGQAADITKGGSPTSLQEYFVVIRSFTERRRF